MGASPRRQVDEIPFRSIAARLRIKHLQLVEALDRSGSLRTAARELNLTQSALSKALREIESAFDMKLFERSRSGMHPTEQGLIVIRGARLMLGELSHLHQEAATAAGRAGALVRLGTLPFIAPWLAPKIAQAFQQSTPPGLLRLKEEGAFAVLLSDLLDGQLDALITAYTPETAAEQAMASLRCEILLEVSFSVITPAAGRPRTRRTHSWKDLADERWLLPARPSFVRHRSDEIFLRQGIDPPVPIVESNNVVTNISLVAAGIGTAIVPTALLDRRARSMVRILPVAPALDPLHIALVFRPSMEKHPRLKLLRHALASIFPSPARLERAERNAR